MITETVPPREATATSATTDSTETTSTSDTAPVTQEADQQPKSGMFAALSVPNFRIYVTGSFVSNIGTWMQNVVLGAYVYDQTRSSSIVGLVLFAQLGPMLLFSVVGGMLADTFERWDM